MSYYNGNEESEEEDREEKEVITSLQIPVFILYSERDRQRTRSFHVRPGNSATAAKTTPSTPASEAHEIGA
ncbi:MAG: hypothetical protein IAI49_01415 [Candidatus Eremiobacteraeota bacterium]|nr:hypothetical protein [Candidatus Eremiobacteraeota bacterium]